ncbi:hypothetical protein SUGI_0993640 [Cryptomeria japonica]|nr:hypothetical protein SUGI_0993640 [Cryptomeria japonica]
MMEQWLLSKDGLLCKNHAIRFQNLDTVIALIVLGFPSQWVRCNKISFESRSTFFFTEVDITDQLAIFTSTGMCLGNMHLLGTMS